MFIGHTNKPRKGQKKGWHYNPGQNVGALSVSGEEIAIQVDPSPPPRLHGQGQCWLVASQTPFTYLAHVKVLNFVRGGGGVGGGVILVKSVFMSVYLRLAANSIQKHVKKG